MRLLFIVSLIWAFSFGVIGSTLHGVSPGIVSCLRLALATAVFAPFVQRLPRRAALAFGLIGALQFGLMYLTYNWAFQFLQGHQVALLTVTTPFFVSAAQDLRNASISLRNGALATLAVAGAATVIGGRDFDNTRATVAGIALTQLSNLCFAVGQIAYRRQCENCGIKKSLGGDIGVFFYCYLGAALVTAPFAAISLLSGFTPLTCPELLALLYLGVIASGAGFFLWNRGARLVPAGVLAVMNNLKVPLAVAVSLLVFHERADLPRLLAGGTVVFFAAAMAHRWASR